MSSDIIPFHALPIYKESIDFVLTDEDEKSVIVNGEFRKALSKQDETQFLKVQRF